MGDLLVELGSQACQFFGVTQIRSVDDLVELLGERAIEEPVAGHVQGIVGALHLAGRIGVVGTGRHHLLVLGFPGIGLHGILGHLFLGAGLGRGFTLPVRLSLFGIDLVAVVLVLGRRVGLVIGQVEMANERAQGLGKGNLVTDDLVK